MKLAQEKEMATIKKLKYIWDHLEEWIAVALFLFVLVVLFFQCIARYVFHNSAPWPEELSSFALIWITYITASYAVKENAHLRIDCTMAVYPVKVRKYVELLGTVAWLVTGIILAYYGTLYTIHQAQIHSTATSITGLPLWTIYLAIPFGHVLVTLRLIESIIRQIRDIIQGKDNFSKIEIVSTEVDEDELGGQSK